MDNLPLTLLSPGTTARIAGITCTEPGLVHKLAALGVLPGLPVNVIQSFPSFLIQVDQTLLALDRTTARCINVII